MYYAIYDRKSPRHNWQIYTITKNQDRFKLLCSEHHQQMITFATIRKDWSNAQLGYVIGDHHTFDTQLPKQTVMEKIWKLKDNV